MSNGTIRGVKKNGKKKRLGEGRVQKITGGDCMEGKRKFLTQTRGKRKRGRKYMYIKSGRLRL